MGLFDKKTCDICGEKIGLLGNKKLEDGNMCKDCASKLSPLFSDRRNSTIEEIREQLKYREENAVQIKTLMPDKVFGDGRKVYVDTKNNKFFVTSASNWKDANPDIIDLSQLISCDVEVVEEKEELFQEDEAGNKKSYTPKKFEYSYRFEAVIRVNSPWFDEIEVELADGDYPDSKFTEKYHKLESELYELKSTLTGVKELAPQEQIKEGIGQVFNTIIGAMSANQNANTAAAVNNASQDSWVCSCGTANTGNFCRNCGNKKPAQQAMIKCDKCGWTSEDFANPPKFCPNCGDPIDIKDVSL